MQGILINMLLNLEKLFKKNLTDCEKEKLKEVADILNEIYDNRYLK